MGKKDILDLHFTNEEISKGIKKLQNYKACELDSISEEMIKARAPVICLSWVLFKQYIK